MQRTTPSASPPWVGAVNGTVTLSEDKAKVTYTHDGSETSSGSFTYTISDGTATDTATVNVSVTPVNDPPGALTVTDQAATAGSRFTYQVTEVIDPDSDTTSPTTQSWVKPETPCLTGSLSTRTLAHSPARLGRCTWASTKYWSRCRTVRRRPGRSPSRLR